MKQRNLLLLATVLAGSVGLASLGISHAQSTTPTTTPVDSVVAPSTIATSTTTPPPMMPGQWSGHHGQRLADQAKKFGMTTADLQAAIASGKPMYQIAAEHGVTYATEKASRLADLKTRLDDMVKVKYMTQTEADAVYKQAQDSATIGGLGFGGPHGPR